VQCTLSNIEEGNNLDHGIEAISLGVSCTRLLWKVRFFFIVLFCSFLLCVCVFGDDGTNE
jgi:hypothetical protein